MPIAIQGNQITFNDSTIQTSANVSTNQLLFDSGSLYYRNRIINGDMRFNQRYFEPSASEPKSTVTLNDDYLYVVDRFRLGGGSSISTGSGSYTVQRLVDAPTGTGLIYSARTTTTAIRSANPTQAKSFRTQLEGRMVSDLMWGTAQARTCTVSFWVKSNITGNHTFGIYEFGNGNNYLVSYPINNANTWEYKQLVIPPPPSNISIIDSNWAISIFWTLGAPTSETGGVANTWSTNIFSVLPSHVQLWATLNSYLQITGVQFEIGTKATPFEHRPYSVELALCQRYFCRCTRWAWSQPIYNIVYRLIPPNPNVPMRTRPTISIFHPGTGAANQSYEHSSGATRTWSSVSESVPTGTDSDDYRVTTAYGQTNNASYSNYVNALYNADF